MTVEDAIIGVLGAGILGLLGFFLQSIKSDIRALGERMGRSEAILGDMREQLAGVTVTQAVHGRILAEHSGTLADHGRILADHSRTLADHGRVLAEVNRTLADHGRVLAEVNRTLADHGRVLAEVNRTHAEQGNTLTDHERMLADVVGYGERIASLEGAAGGG